MLGVIFFVAFYIFLPMVLFYLAEENHISRLRLFLVSVLATVIVGVVVSLASLYLFGLNPDCKVCNPVASAINFALFILFWGYFALYPFLLSSTFILLRFGSKKSLIKNFLLGVSLGIISATIWYVIIGGVFRIGDAETAMILFAGVAGGLSALVDFLLNIKRVKKS